MKLEADIVILGAGIAGLGAYRKATTLGRKAVIFEAAPAAGGLLDNFEVQGFRFDHAVHLSFATEPEVREIFDKVPYLTHPADAYNFDDGKWLKHPAQNNIFPLEPEEKTRLIQSFLSRPEGLNSDTYEDWLRHQYGDALSERFPLRYTRKYWQTEAKNLSTQWIGNRMRRANLEEILFGAFTDKTPNTYYTKEMRYPKFGGYKSFIADLIAEADIRLNRRAVHVNTLAKTVSFENGDEVRYNTLVSTLPLPLLIEMLDCEDADVKAASAQLQATSIDLLSVGFKSDIIKDLWFYIYDEDIHASRAYSPSVKSPDNAPPGCSSLQFEIYSLGRTSKHTPDTLIQNTRYALEKMKICSADDIMFIHHKHVQWGNVVFFQDMETHRERVLAYLQQQQIKTCGRFGDWDYLWSNQALMSGLSLDFET